MIYCHSPLFGAYRKHAVPYYRKVIGQLLDRLAPERLIEATGLPTTAEAYLLRQDEEGGRFILHLIHATPQRRGDGIETVEDILPLYNVRIGVRIPRAVSQVYLAPGGEVLAHEQRDGLTWVEVPAVRGRAVVVFTSG